MNPTRPRTDDFLRDWRFYLAVFAFWTLNGLLLFAYHYLDVFVRGYTEPAHQKLIEELTGAWGGALLMPVVIWLARRFRRPIVLAILAQFVAGVAVSTVHTTWNWWARTAAYRLFGYGEYDYGIMRLRYLMELPNDLVWYSIFVVITLLFDYYRGARDRELRLAELEAEMSKVRLQALEARLHPHFLFNALNTVSAVMYESVDEADRVLTRLGEFLRRTLRSDTTSEVPLREELATLELYLDIIRARFGDRLQVTVDAESSARDGAVPPLVLQPLVENAIKHGDPGPGRAARITVSARRANGTMTIEVADNGPGLGESVDEALTRGIGLSTTQRRLERLYGSAGALSLTTGDEGGLTVRLALPFRHAPER